MDSRLLLSIIGCLVSFPMAALVLAAGLKPGGRKPYLSLVFLEAALYFLAGTFPNSPAISLALGLGSSFYCLPSLYLFVREASGCPPRRALIHYLPALVNAPVGVGLALLFASRGFRGGWLAAAYIAATLLGQSVQLAAYGRAALKLTAAKAVAAPSGGGGAWIRRVAIAALSGYGLFLVLGWISYGAELAADLAGRRIGAFPWIELSSLLVGVLIAWTVGLCVIWGYDYSSPESREDRKYGGRPLSAEQAAELVGRALALLASMPDLAAPGTAPRELAKSLGVRYYLLSRAVNEGEGISLAELVNGCRIDRAKRMLAERPGSSILEVALESGFQAKSTFNEVFRKATGLSPREYRSRAAGRTP
jgi:AraC-like DNA-binding protein